jgi:hypothetical protein
MLPKYDWLGVDAALRLLTLCVSEKCTTSAKTSRSISYGDERFFYHPQNIALMQWFEQEVLPAQFTGAYSYPDEGVLIAPSPRQNAGCQ